MDELLEQVLGRWSAVPAAKRDLSHPAFIHSLLQFLNRLGRELRLMTLQSPICVVLVRLREGNINSEEIRIGGVPGNRSRPIAIDRSGLSWG